MSLPGSPCPFPTSTPPPTQLLPPASDNTTTMGPDSPGEFAATDACAGEAATAAAAVQVRQKSRTNPLKRGLCNQKNDLLTYLQLVVRLRIHGLGKARVLASRQVPQKSPNHTKKEPHLHQKEPC